MLRNYTDTEEYKQKAKELIKSHFEYIRTFTKDLFTLFRGKGCLGTKEELISTGMMNLYLERIAAVENP